MVSTPLNPERVVASSAGAGIYTVISNDSAQLSDSLRLLAPEMHIALDRLLAHFSPAIDNAVSPPGCSEELAQLCNQLDELINMLRVVDAQAAVQLLSRLRALLVHCAQHSDPAELQLSSSQAGAAVTALWSLHDYLDDLHDRSGDTDIFDPTLFQGWRLVCLQLPVDASDADGDSPQACDLEAILQALQTINSRLVAQQSPFTPALASWQTTLQVFVTRIIDGLLPLDRHAVTLLEMPHGPLIKDRIEALQRRADWSPSLALVHAPESPLMVRLMMQVDEMQAAWGRFVTATPVDQRAVPALQWMASILVAADLARRIWPRLREPGLSGLLRSLGQLAGGVDPAALREDCEREFSNCQIFLEECLRRRAHLDDDFIQQSDCIVEHLAGVLHGDVLDAPFPWFSRELRASMTRHMSGVLERDIRDALTKVERGLEWFWSGQTDVPGPVNPPVIAAADDWPVESQRSLTTLLTDIHAELGRLESLCGAHPAREWGILATTLRERIARNLAATLSSTADEGGARQDRTDTARAVMVRDIVRFDQQLQQAMRSPPNRWRRPRPADMALAAGIRHALTQGDLNAPPVLAADGPTPDAAAVAMLQDDFGGSWQPHPPDDEMLQVFVGEARSLLRESHDILVAGATVMAQPEPLSNIRRCFHTIKGSGRMVGLTALSDAAYAIEKLLSACVARAQLQEPLPRPEAVAGLLQSAHRLFVAWIDEFGRKNGSSRQAPALVALCQRLMVSLNPPPEAPDDVALVSPDDQAEQVGDPDQQLRQIYLEEATGLFKTLRQHGSSWRAKANSGLLSGAPVLYLRAMHTLRGCSAAAGFDGMRDMAAAVDELIGHLQQFGLGLNAAQLTIVESALARMQEMQQHYAAGAEPAADPPALQALHDLQHSLLAPGPAVPAVAPVPVPAAVSMPAAAAAAPATMVHETPMQEVHGLQDEIDLELLPVFLEEGAHLMALVGEGLHRFQRQPDDDTVLAEVLRPLHTVKGNARMAGALQLGHRIHELESGVQRLLRNSHDSDALDVLLAIYDDALQRFSTLEQLGAAAQPVSDGVRRLAEPMVRIKVSLLDTLLNQIGEVSIARSQLENEVVQLRRHAHDLDDNIGKLSAQLRDVAIQAEIRIEASYRNQDGTHFDPLELDRYTHLQELTRMMDESVNDVASLQKLLADSAATTQNGLQRQARLTRDLQRELMYARMIKFKSVEPRLRHLVWQLARETGKALELVCSGGEVELDRGILEKMIGPFEHLLRNAAVHGIEAPAQRAAAGKPATGRLRIQALQEGSEATIRIDDDGIGLDLAAIRAKALAANLLSAAQLDDDARVIEMIFEPGLSTSSSVSALAGRGVGMDVVRSEVTALGGRVVVQSQAGAGARFTMHLPLSLAVKQVCLLRLGLQSYAIPSMLIEKVVQLRGQHMRQALASGEMEEGGRSVALHALAALLDEPVDPNRPVPDSVYVLFVKSGSDLVAIMVDHVSGNREVVSKPLGPQLDTLAGVVGATVMGNGEIVLILNPLLLERRSGYRRQHGAVLAQPGRVRQCTIMVIDDSLTVRKVMQRLLTREGYKVVTATDGYDAIRQLHGVTPDVFLVDIEMPRMDGFTLVRHLRDNEATRTRPIIMITSRTGAKHRERAMELGVNHYLGKPYQDQQLLSLLATYTSAPDQLPPDDFSDVLY
jgi:chemotaxis protein histidine kinase CheA/ActR/RegA family two-component response regulator